MKKKTIAIELRTDKNTYVGSVYAAHAFIEEFGFEHGWISQPKGDRAIRWDTRREAIADCEIRSIVRSHQ